MSAKFRWHCISIWSIVHRQALHVHVAEPCHEKQCFAYAKTEAQMSCAICSAPLLLLFVDNTIRTKSEISSLKPSSAETPTTGFLISLVI